MSEVTTPPCPTCGERFASTGDMMALLDALKAWRAEHEHPSAAAAVPEAQDGRECVFCAKARDERWRRTVESFEPLNPVTLGHRLFVPREHVTDAAENHVLTGVVFEAAARYAESRGEAFNLITSAGVAATQSVWHLHVHYVPRRDDDGLTLPWTGQAASAAVREGERERPFYPWSPAGWYLDLLRAVKSYDDANQSDLPLGLLASISEAVNAAAPSLAAPEGTGEKP